MRYDVYVSREEIRVRRDDFRGHEPPEYVARTLDDARWWVLLHGELGDIYNPYEVKDNDLWR